MAQAGPTGAVRRRREARRRQLIALFLVFIITVSVLAMLGSLLGGS